jgi:hypothetical protein
VAEACADVAILRLDLEEDGQRNDGQQADDDAEHVLEVRVRARLVLLLRIPVRERIAHLQEDDDEQRQETEDLMMEWQRKRKSGALANSLHFKYNAQNSKKRNARDGKRHLPAGS